MTDIAALGLSIDSDGILKASSALDKFADASSKASKASDDLTSKTKRVASAEADSARATSGATKAAYDSAKAIQAEAAQRDRLSRMVEQSIRAQEAERAATVSNLSQQGQLFQSVAGSRAAYARQSEQMRETTRLLAAEEQKAAVATQSYSAEVARLKAQLEPAFAALQKYRQQIELLRKAKAEGAITQQQYVEAIRSAKGEYQQAANGLAKVGAVSGSTRAGMQQLSYQINDVATMFAMGAKPMQIFASQSGQVVQAVQLMTGGTSKLAGFLGGPWGIALTTATIALTPFIAKLIETKDAATDMANAMDTAVKRFYASLVQASSLQQALTEEGNKHIKALGEIARLEREIQKTRDAASVSRDAGYLYFRLADLERQRDAAKATAEGAQASMRGAIADQNLLEARRKVIEATSSQEKAENSRTGSISAGTRAVNQANEATQQFISSLEDEIAKIGLTEQALRALEIQKAKDAAVTQAQKDRIEELSQAREKAIQDEQRLERIRGHKDRAAELMKEVKAAEQQAMVMLMEGWERERLLLLMQREAELRPLLTKLAQAQAFSTQAEAEAVQAEIDALDAKYRALIQNGNAGEVWRKEAEAVALLNQNLQSLNGLLGSGPLGGLFQVLTSSNPSATLLGMGGIGSLIGLGTGQGREALDKQKKAMQEALEGVLGKNSAKLAGQLAGVIQNAGIGLSAGQSIVGRTGTVGKVGGALGGILGGIGGQALSGAVTAAATSALGGTLGAAIGSAVPVVGTIIGGVLGTLAGSLLKKAQRGSAILTGAGVTGYYGNSSANKSAAGTLGGNIMDSLAALAQQLGGSLDSAAGRTSIGVRDGKYYVDTQGRGYTKSSISGVTGFGTDEKAAVAFAIKDLINDGVLTGLRAGTLDLIKNAKDLEEGIAKALQFEAIMQMLEAGSSELVQQVRAIKAQFEQYIAVMKEAGASVADLTRVQALQQQQINAMIAQAGASYRATFYTDSQNLDFAKNQIKAVLDPLGYGWIDTVKEYMAEVEKAQKDTSEEGLAWLDTLYSLSDAFGTVKAAADAAAAAKKAEAEQRSAEKANNLAKAQDALRQAYDREASSLRQTIENAKEMGRTLRDLANDLGGIVGATNEYETALSRLRRIGGLAGMGDTAAQQQLASVIDAFLPTARANAATDVDYRRSVALAAQYANSAARAAETQASEGQKQLDALTKQVGLLIDLNDGVMTVAQATQQLVALMGGTPKSVSGGTSPAAKAPIRPMSAEQMLQQMQERLQEQMQKMNEKMERVVVNTGRTSRRLDGWDRQGAMGVTADSVQPVEVVVANG